nr:ribosome-inactivating protein [Tanacetum cinerariifolium]
MLLTTLRIPQPDHNKLLLETEEKQLSILLHRYMIKNLLSLSFKKIYKPTNNNLRTSSNTSRANKDNSPRINKSTGYDNQRIGNVAGARETVARECHKPKRAKDAAYHKEKMLLCKKEEAGFQLSVEQADWRDDTDDEPEDQELEAHYIYMAQIQEVTPDAVDNSGPIFDTEPLQKVPNNDHYNVFTIESEHPEQSKSINDTYPIEQDEHNVIINSLDMSYDRQHIDQNDDDDDLANERDLLASLIDKLKCEIDDSKNRKNTTSDDVFRHYWTLGFHGHESLDSIILLKCQGWGNQSWTFMADGTILNPNARLVMDVQSSDVSLQDIIMYQPTGNPNQKWLAYGFHS